jgi:hypothetical protein
MNSLNKHLLLEENGWDKISCSKIENWKKKGCPTKEVAGSCFVNKSKCKTKPKPTPPKPEPPKPEPPKEDDEKNDITGCFWKPEDKDTNGNKLPMNFRCNDGCGISGSGDIFREYVNKHFPEIANKYELAAKGPKVLSYCNKTMKDVYTHVYDSNKFPGLKGKTIGKIYDDGYLPDNFIMDCEPWETNNYFIRDYPTDEERDQAAFKMIVSFNDEFDKIFDRTYLKQCDVTIDNDLGWAEKNNKKDLHKNPVVKIIANKSPYKEKWYDYWKKSLVKKESILTNVIERKLNIKKKLKEMKKNKTISENVREKLKVSKLDRKLNLKENSKYFFNESYRKFFDNYFNTKVLNSLNESELGDFDIAFNAVFGGHEESFIEKGIQYILNKLQIDPNSDMGKKISERFKSLPKEEAKKMIDPQYVSETIVSILPETFINVSDPSGDGLETIVKNTIAKLAASRTTLDDLTHQISQKVKQSLEDLKNTTIETSSDMKKSYIEKLKSSI